MKKVLLVIVPLLIALAVFASIAFFLSRNDGKGALQVTAVPKSTVFLNGEEIGTTPLCKCELPQMVPTGEYTIRLVPQENGFSPFEEKISIKKSVLTVVDRTFAQGSESEGSIITLTPLDNKEQREILIISLPDDADVLLNNTMAGTTPLLLKDVTESDQSLKIRKIGYKEKDLRIRTVTGYKLEARVFLGINEGAVSLSPTPTASPSATPASETPKITILQTPVGFLRVRARASVNAPEIGQVRPGEQYDILEEEDGWFQITLTDGKVGWVSSQYARKEEPSQ